MPGLAQDDMNRCFFPDALNPPPPLTRHEEMVHMRLFERVD